MRYLLVLLTLCSCSLVGDELSDSIIPLIDELEAGQLLKAKRFSEIQWQEIEKVYERVDQKVRIVSFNILFTYYEHQLEAKHKWANRKTRVISAINSLNADIILPQELLKHQLDDLNRGLGDRYAFYGIATHDGVDKGELNGVFYLKDRFQVIDQKVIWLTNTPNRPSIDEHGKGHTLTLACLRDLKTGETFTVGNTHVAFRSVDSRQKSVCMIAEIAETICQQQPFVMCGDFNAFPQRPQERYPFLDGDHIERIMTGGSLRNSRGWAILGCLGPISSFTNAGAHDVRPFRGTGTPGVILDKAYVSPRVTVLTQSIDPVRVDGEYPSDHMPLILDVVFEPAEDIEESADEEDEGGMGG